MANSNYPNETEEESRARKDAHNERMRYKRAWLKEKHPEKHAEFCKKRLEQQHARQGFVRKRAPYVKGGRDYTVEELREMQVRWRSKWRNDPVKIARYRIQKEKYRKANREKINKRVKERMKDPVYAEAERARRRLRDFKLREKKKMKLLEDHPS